MGTTIQARRKLLFAALGGGSHIDNEYVNRHCRSPSRKYLHKYITLFLNCQGIFDQSPLFEYFNTDSDYHRSEKHHAPDRPAVMIVTDRGACGVGAEDHAGEEADCEAAQGRDRIQMLPEKRGEDRDRGGDIEHITAQQPAVEIAVLTYGRCAEQPREEGVVTVAPYESADQKKEKVPRRDAEGKEGVLLHLRLEFRVLLSLFHFIHIVDLLRGSRGASFFRFYKQIDRGSEDLRELEKLFRARRGLIGFPFGYGLTADSDELGELFLRHSAAFSLFFNSFTK